MNLKPLFKKALRKIHRPAHPNIHTDFAEEIESLHQLGKFRFSVLSSPSSPELNGGMSISPKDSDVPAITVDLREDFATGLTRYLYADHRASPPATQEFIATDKADLDRLRQLLRDFIETTPRPNQRQSSKPLI